MEQIWVEIKEKNTKKDRKHKSKLFDHAHINNRER